MRTPSLPLRLTSATAIAVVLFTLAGRGQEAGTPTSVASVLRQAGFSDVDLGTLESGRVITRTEAAPERMEASVATAVRIATTNERAVAYFKQLISYVDGQVTLAYGPLGRPPRDGDLRGLTLESADLADLRACQPAACDVRIGSASPADIVGALDWQAANAGERANAWMRQRLAAYAADYLKRGDAALVTFDDKGAPVDIQVQWRDIISRSSALATLAPTVQRYLTSGLTDTASGASDEMYWDRERLTGLKSVIGLTHLITWPDPAQPGRTVIVQRQIHSSHYLYGSLAVVLIEQDRRNPAAPTTYVAYFNRSRGDLLKPPPPPATTGLRARVTSLSARIGANLQQRLGSELIGQSAERLMSAMKQALER